MANPQKRKGDAAEREAAQLLSDLLGLVVRRKLGAGRTTRAGGDTGDCSAARAGGDAGCHSRYGDHRGCDVDDVWR